jgi:hypothetical protein
MSDNSKILQNIYIDIIKLSSSVNLIFESHIQHEIKYI